MFVRKGSHGVHATQSDAVQEAIVLVNGGYRPDTIIAERDKPVRLLFRRDEASPCSEEIVFERLGVRAKLPEGQVVALELPGREPGEYAFSCGHGMLHGRLIVE